ncbi:MAG: Ig-like domain repeat protein, partial [Solirubrobacterales bacterium]
SIYSFKVDNTDPAAPADFELEDAESGWSDTNSFDASWINTVEDEETETQSGVGSVVVDVEPTNGAQINPAPITIPIGTTVSGVTATKSSISGLNVPEVGRWALKLSVVDRAGNISPHATGADGARDENGNPIVGFDPNPPAAPGLQNNGWVSNDNLIAGYSQEWTQTVPQSGSPICGYAGLVDPSPIANPGTDINIDGPVNDWTLPTDLAEGTHWVHLRSIACNGLASPSVSSVDVKVDRTDPVSYFSGVTPGRWYKAGSVVTIGANDAPSGMAPAPQDDPFDRGAYLDHSINGSSPAEPTRGGQAHVSVSGEGTKELRFTAVDLAGNRNSETVVKFGIDASNPTGFLNNQDPARPTLLSAPLGDEVSGLESAVIDVQRESGGDWITLPTGLADLSGAAVAGNPKSALASARFPDTSLPQDRYRVRVRSTDQAGNSLVTDRDKSGYPLIVDSGAMRSFSGLSASLFKSRRTCKKRATRKTRKGRSRHRVIRCTKRHRGKVIFIGGKSSVNVGFKRGAVVQGYLTDARYGALARQPIEIYTAARGKAEVLAGVTSTKADGSYLFKLKPGLSRSIRVYYPGTETRRDTSARVSLSTGAKLVLRVSKRKARTGQTVTFRGSVMSFDRAFPASGKIIALQFYAGKKWRPAVAIARTNSKGRFAVKYKFDGKRVKARLVFRVVAPFEEGWGHSTSASRRLTMRLN